MTFFRVAVSFGFCVAVYAAAKIPICQSLFFEPRLYCFLWFDMFFHFFGGVGSGALVISSLSVLPPKTFRRFLTRNWFIFFMVSIGLLWEVWELWNGDALRERTLLRGLYFGLDPFYASGCKDLVFDLLGGGLVFRFKAFLS